MGIFATPSTTSRPAGGIFAKRKYAKDALGWYDTETGERLPGMPLEEFTRQAAEEWEPPEPKPPIAAYDAITQLGERWLAGSPAEALAGVARLGVRTAPSNVLGRLAGVPGVEDATALVDRKTEPLVRYGQRTLEDADAALQEAGLPAGARTATLLGAELLGPEELAPGGVFYRGLRGAKPAARVVSSLADEVTVPAVRETVERVAQTAPIPPASPKPRGAYYQVSPEGEITLLPGKSSIESPTPPNFVKVKVTPEEGVRFEVGDEAALTPGQIEAMKELRRPVKRVASPVEAMEHAGVAASPEALAREATSPAVRGEVLRTRKYRGSELSARPDQKSEVLVFRSPEGDDLGYVEAVPGQDGFRVAHVWVEESSRGKGIPEILYREAKEKFGSYLGPTDHQGRRTPAGERMAERMRETSPDLFEPASISLGKPRMTPGPSIKPPELPGQVNVQKFGLPKESEAALVDLIRREAPRLEKAGFGKTVTWEETVAAAENLARRTNRSVDELTQRFSSQKGILDAPELTLVNSMVQGTDNEMRALVAKMKGVTDPGELDKLKTMQDALAERYVGLLELSVGNSSRAARALNAQRMVTDALDMPNFQRRQLLKKFKPRMTDEARAALANLDPNDPEQVSTFLGHLKADNFGEYAWTYWVSSVLSGLGTQARNLFGNASHFASEAVVRPVRAALDVPLARAAGRSREFYFREALPDATATLTGLRDGMRKAASVIAHGVNPDDPAKISGRAGMGLNPWLHLHSENRLADKALKALGVAIDTPFRALGATDAVFRTLAETTEAHRLVTRQALKEGLRPGTTEFAGRMDLLLREMPPELTAQVAEHGKKMTFTDEAGPITKWMMQGQQQLPAPVSTALRLANPFAKVMGRITARGLELSPLGAFKVGKTAWQAAKQAGSARAALSPEVVDLMSRAAIGSGIMMGAASWAGGKREDGLPHLVAWAPRDPKAKDEFYNLQKLKPWSIVLGPPGKAVVVPFAALEPFSFPLAMAAGYTQRSEETKESLPENRAFEVALGVGRYLTDKSMMQGLSDLLEMLDDNPQAPAKAQRFGMRAASGALPASAMLRDITHLLGDDAVRDPQGIVDHLLVNIPGLSEQVPARLDPLGNPIERTPGGWRSLFSQTPMNYVKVPEFYPPESSPRWEMLADDEKLAVARLELQRAGATPGYIERRVVLPDGQKKILTHEEWRSYQETSGAEQEEAIKLLLSDPRYWQAPPEARADALHRAIYGEFGARARARQKVFGWGTRTR